MSVKRTAGGKSRDKSAAMRRPAPASAMRSLRLALEPRLVFDASVAVTAA